jgi:Arc/MetJ-type ribon-helix-helix transcriptional regulator
MTEVTVNIPPALHQQLEDRIRQTEFDSLEEYVQFVLQAIADEDGEADEGADGADHEQLEERLKNLGYV